MNYYIDTEFLEGRQRLRKSFLEALFAVKIFTEPTIDLISIGIVSEDGREYYAVSKDFNLKEAWFRCQLEEDNSVGARIGCKSPNKKVYWIRENVLRPIYNELSNFHLNNIFNHPNFGTQKLDSRELKFDYESLKFLIKSYGKSNKQISEDIKRFIAYTEEPELSPADYESKNLQWKFSDVKFYGYYADYDWVVFCWLFGNMIDLPKGWPMYCIDLKQILDEKAVKYVDDNLKEPIVSSDWHSNYCLNELKRIPNYPKQTNEHNALSDARWNKQLHEFLNKL